MKAGQKPWCNFALPLLKKEAMENEYSRRQPLDKIILFSYINKALFDNNSIDTHMAFSVGCSLLLCATDLHHTTDRILC